MKRPDDPATDRQFPESFANFVSLSGTSRVISDLDPKRLILDTMRRSGMIDRIRRVSNSEIIEEMFGTIGCYRHALTVVLAVFYGPKLTLN